ncbi:endoglucanase [Nissabacter sp. SGAir0207]|nr:glycosyl hydrolase family 8 [Nissabacter sp. SGAir0207]QCR34663.1 endoglucanase [Nissabacter sp. SGAir0207]
MMRAVRHAALILVLGLFSALACAQGEGWSQFKSRFLMPDGRIVDTANRSVSHTEGQGFSMLLAVFNNDRPTFDRLYQWADKTLYRKEVGLYAWRFDPNAKEKVGDKNNAADGDILMAWALLLAGDKWHHAAYTRASEKLQAAIVKHNVVEFAGKTVMLPGIYGFNHTSYVTLNPSYFLFPAWKAFYQHSHLKVWKSLNDDCLALLQQMNFGKVGLPTDWVTLRADGSLSPAEGWPPRFSYDAVRIPLYLNWAERGTPALQPFVHYWQGYPRDNTPAFIDVQSGAKANYALSPGMLAVRDVTLGDDFNVTDTLQDDDGYYSSALQLLAYWSVK